MYFKHHINPKLILSANSRSLLANAGVQGALQVAIHSAEFLKIGFLGTANICNRFNQCCNRKGFFIPCSVPCNAVKAHHWSSDTKLSHNAYFPSQQYKTKGRWTQRDFSINIREVTEYNKEFVPPFRAVGFAFRDLSKFETLSSPFSKYNMQNFNQMIHRLSHLAAELLPGPIEITKCDITRGEQRMLMRICEDFAVSNNKKIVSNIETETLIKANGIGTPIHFDGNAGIDYPVLGGTIIRVWIPLSDIDNYPLVVGDARSYFNQDGVCDGYKNVNSCAEDRDFKDAVWYHQPMMTTTDAIFWNLKTAPHGSVDFGNNRNTKERFAFVFDFVVKDIVPESRQPICYLLL